MLLVPGGGRQHDVGQQGGRGHPEVGRQQQVELALRRLVAPGHVPRPDVLGALGGHHVAVGAEQVLQEVLVALGRGAHQVGAPQGQGPRPVLRGVDVLDRRLQGAVGQPVRHVRRGVLGLAGLDRAPSPGRPDPAGSRRTAGRTASSPSVPTGRSCRRCACRRGCPRPAAKPARRRVAVEPPLVGVHVPVRGADHGPRRPGPVQRVGQREPAGDRPALLLADVVGPAAAVAAHRTGQDQQAEDRPVRGVAVEPLADPGAHDDHGPAFGLLGVVRELAGDPDARLGRHAGDLRLPGRGVRAGRVVVAGRPLARQLRRGPRRTGPASGRTRW